jgi:uncharacterized protein (TIGR03067 family)
MMTTRLVLSLTVAVAAATAAPAQDTRKDMQELEGTWKFVSAEMFGKKLGERDLDLEKIVVQGDTITLQRPAGRESKPLTFVLTPTRTPRTIDLLTVKDEAAKVWKGIYAVDGDELRLCLPYVRKGGGNTDPVRPESFDTAGRPHLVIIAKRERPRE